VETLGHTVLLDCGSGLVQFGMEMGDITSFDILLGHLHIDHINGLSSFPPLLRPGFDIRLFTKSRGCLPLKEQVLGVYRPPYWPIPLAKLARIDCVPIEMDVPFELKPGIRVLPFDSYHPDDTIGFRVEADKTLVYLLDCEVPKDPEKYKSLVEYAKGADCVIFDAAYLPRDYKNREGWGHSTYEDAVRLYGDSGCGRIVLSHFSYDYTDGDIDSMDAALKKSGICYNVAFDGLECDV
jgi:ribonuclease BN (tRNA processing enzyme)